MKPWTRETMLARLDELIGDPTDERHALRIRILDEAHKQFVAFGFRRANIGEIARAAGIGKGTLYLHFDSKQTMLIAALAREKQQLVPKLHAMMALPPRERLEAYLRMSVHFSLTAELSGRILRGDAEMKRIAEDYNTSHKDEQEQGLQFLMSIVEASAPHHGEPKRRELAQMVMAAVTTVGFLPSVPWLHGMELDAFIDNYATALARGVQC